MENKVVKVTGMTCAACSASIERAVGRMQGVESVASFRRNEVIL